jgi:NADPH:quinone reductase-like Zn-dependent oxidoreductase
MESIRSGRRCTNIRMKAVLIRKFGAPDVMDIEDVDVPLISNDELLVRIHSSSVNPVDWKIRNGSLRFITGTKFPMSLGFDVAGEVVKIGLNVRRFKKDDRVFAMLRYRERGAYAEFVRVRESDAALMPEEMDFMTAAAIPLAGLTAYQGLHYKGSLTNGESVLVNGASGGVGSFAVQLAKAGRASVTAVCGTDNLERLRGLGIDKVIDYRKDDFTAFPTKYDIIFDAVGKLSFFGVRRNLNDAGRYITTLPNAGNVCSFFLLPFLTVFGYHKRAMMINVKPNGSDLEYLAILSKKNKVVPLIDRVYPLDKIREAHAYSEAGHARGKIVIKISR